ncbi:MAG: Cof-like hydrolase [Phenylobacterium sp.]|nr:Cof-like hydrolase [Phenylobacterium sp.]
MAVVADAAPRPPIAFLISDVDGTLVTPDKRLTEAAAAAVRSLRRAGVGFSLISSRPPRGMAVLLDALEVDQPFAAFNGGSILGPDGDILERLTVPPEAARMALALFDLHGIDSWVFAHGEWWLRDPHGVNTDRERRTVGFEPSVTASFEGLLSEAEKIVGVSNDHDLLARVEALAQARLAGLAAAVRSQPYYLDVTHIEANKGHAVRAICRRLGLDLQRLAVIGDMANDVSMFVEAGFAIAMGQAPEAVRAAADAVTGPNTDDGFAEAVRRYILPRAGVGSAP